MMSWDYLSNALFLFMMVGVGLSVDPYCGVSQNYSPCVCYDWTGGVEIACFGVPLNDVYKVFHTEANHSVANYHRVRIDLNERDQVIPENLLGPRTTQILEIFCPDPAFSYMLQVDKKAFESTKDAVTSFDITNCDLTQLDFNFLAGFDNLETLTISTSYNLAASFRTLPILPKLVNLEINHCPKLNQFTEFPTVKGIEYLLLSENPDLRDETVDQILDWIAGSSATTLVNLGLNGNNLTRIPNGISKFTSLNSLELQNNKISMVKSGELHFTAPVKSLFLYADEIEMMEYNPFHGDFSQAKVIAVMGNRMKAFDEAAFGKLLQHLYDTESSAKINVDQNPFDCSNCHIVWLVRDYPHFISFIDNGVCSDGTPFSELKPEYFKGCASLEVTTEPTTTGPTTDSASQLKSHVEFMTISIIMFVITFLKY